MNKERVRLLRRTVTAALVIGVLFSLASFMVAARRRTLCLEQTAIKTSCAPENALAWAAVGDFFLYAVLAFFIILAVAFGRRWFRG